MRSLPIALVAALALGGCASAGPAGPGARGAGPAGPAAAPAGKGPAEAALLACGPEGVGDVALALGAAPVTKVAMVADGGAYRCDYVFAAGTMRISVAGFPDGAAATAAMTATRPAGARDVPAVGQQAWATGDGTLHVRKDQLIMTVDVGRLPARFGTPPHPRNIDAITVATAVLACWTEA